MSLKYCKTEKLCRCCLGKGVESMHNLCKSSQLKLNASYIDILKDCFNIIMLELPGPDSDITYSICNKCAQMLHDSLIFKRQVLKSRDIFLDLYTDNNIAKVEPEIKVEKTEIPSHENSDNDIGSVDEALMHALLHDGKPNKKSGDQKFIAIKIKPEMKIEKSDYKKIKRREQARKRRQLMRLATGDPVVGDSARYSGTGKFRLKRSDYRKEDSSYYCTRCDMRFNNQPTLRYHIKNIHYDLRRKFTCTTCNEEFNTKTSLVNHRLDDHNIDERVICNACNRPFACTHTLKRHINCYHKLGRKYKCSACEFECFSLPSLRDHEHNHKTIKEHHCKFCQKSFMRRKNLVLHEKIHTGDKRKVCEVCGQAFVQKASLNYHMTKYHPEVNF